MAAANQNVPMIITQSRQKSWIDYLFYLIFAGVAVWGGKKLYNKWRANNEAGKIGTDPAAQAASTIYNAKGTFVDNEESVIALAKQVKEQGVVFADISKAFTKLYSGKNINDYLNSFMSSDQQTRFFNTLNLTATTIVDKKTGKPIPIKSLDQWIPGKAVITKADANLRKTPRWVQSPAHAALNPFTVLSYKNNVIGIAPMNRLIGTVTNRQPSPTSFDEKAEPTGILFVEIATPLCKDDGTPILDSNKKQVTKNVWVAASQITPYWFKEIAPGMKLDSKYRMYAITQSAYDNAASLAGFGSSAPDFSKEVVATSKVSILNDKFKEVMKAERGLILGYPIMTMKNGNRELINFQTVGGYTWWTDKKHTVTKTL